MTCQVLTLLKVSTPEGIRELQAGEVIALPEDMALQLIEKGKVSPLPKPYLDQSGDVVIPFRSDSRYQWWAGGQSIQKTEEELNRWRH